MLRTIRNTVPIICFVMLLSFPAGIWAVDDDYLSAISDEASSLEMLGDARRELGKARRSAARSKKSGVAPKKIADSEGLKQLEDELQQDFPASFMLYKQLNGADQKLVLSEYTFGSNTLHDDRIFAAINRIILLQVK